LKPRAENCSPDGISMNPISMPFSLRTRQPRPASSPRINFAKTGNPNGAGLPPWPLYSAKDDYPVMHIGADPKVAPDAHRACYLLLDSLR
jgi:carboxylesterase type B